MLCDVFVDFGAREAAVRAKNSGFFSSFTLPKFHAEGYFKISGGVGICS
jgi:hypothetical protein